MIRVLSGQLKGRKLITTADLSVRPTAEKLRAAFFNIVNSQILRGDLGDGDAAQIRFIDVFSGTGAMAIEAISRGFGEIYLIDQNLTLARQNLSQLGLSNRTEICLLEQDALRARNLVVPKSVAGAATRSTVAYFDPPYDRSLILPTLMAWMDGGYFAAGGMIGCETSAEEAEQLSLWLAGNIGDRYKIDNFETRRFGKSVLTLIKII